jgi:phosphoribosylaminoimidazole-succinocarboxamide synthase
VAEHKTLELPATPVAHCGNGVSAGGHGAFGMTAVVQRIRGHAVEHRRQRKSRFFFGNEFFLGEISQMGGSRSLTTVLAPPVFSPATNAETGHDENITIDRMRDIVGATATAELERLSRTIFAYGCSVANETGVIIADTKFEFGRAPDGRIMLIDEVMTPDSSRFWPADVYQPGRPQPSFDKQALRDYLDGERRSGRWNGEVPAPPLPPEIIGQTSERYRDAFCRITGVALRWT